MTMVYIWYVLAGLSHMQMSSTWHPLKRLFGSQELKTHSPPLVD